MGAQTQRRGDGYSQKSAQPEMEALQTLLVSEQPIPQFRPGIHFQLVEQATLLSAWYQIQPWTCIGRMGTMCGVQRFDCWTTPVWLQWERASGLLQRSTDVPPTFEETNPTGTLPSSDSKTPLPKYPVHGQVQRGGVRGQHGDIRRADTGSGAGHSTSPWVPGHGWARKCSAEAMVTHSRPQRRGRSPSRCRWPWGPRPPTGCGWRKWCAGCAGSWPWLDTRAKR